MPESSPTLVALLREVIDALKDGSAANEALASRVEAMEKLLHERTAPLERLATAAETAAKVEAQREADRASRSAAWQKVWVPAATALAGGAVTLGLMWLRSILEGP